MGNSRVKQRREPMCYGSLQWLKDYREQSGKVYEEYPFGVVFHPEEDLYAVLHESLDGSLDVWSYLVLGETAALVIDTGYGIGNYAALVRHLAGDRELTVVLTHHHADHSGGCFEFGSVYTHPFSEPYLRSMMRADAWKRNFDEEGNGIWLDCTKADLLPFREYEICCADSGTKWELGGITAELIWTPGHAVGASCILDSKGRLFSGDEIMAERISAPGNRRGQPYEEYARVVPLRDSIRLLDGRSGEFDRIYPGHHRMPLSADVIEPLLAVCEEVAAHPERYDRIGTNYVPGEKVLLKDIPGLGELEYKLDGIA